MSEMTDFFRIGPIVLGSFLFTEQRDGSRCAHMYGMHEKGTR